MRSRSKRSLNLRRGTVMPSSKRTLLSGRTTTGCHRDTVCGSRRLFRLISQFWSQSGKSSSTDSMVNSALMSWRRIGVPSGERTTQLSVPKSVEGTRLFILWRHSQKIMGGFQETNVHSDFCGRHTPFVPNHSTRTRSVRYTRSVSHTLVICVRSLHI
ncbi:hypothetical protein BJ165DRAFT_1476851 [Panaeolus papilionaceus]|nr:hypothetical protein BJ165DRAFT_1476851 [Panaeolus papilionaceus]